MTIEEPKDGIKIEIRDDKEFSKEVIREVWESNVYRIQKNHISDNGVIIDLGANIGSFSIYMGYLKTNCRVYAYEPQAKNYDMLVKNISKNKLGHIEPVKQAVMRESGKILLIDNGPSSVATKEEIPGYLEYEEVEAVTLEQVFEDNKIMECDILKIDTEGSEYGIIEGAKIETLKKIRRIVMEFHKTEPEMLGALIAKLTLGFKVETLGCYNWGGQIYAERY